MRIWTASLLAALLGACGDGSSPASVADLGSETDAEADDTKTPECPSPQGPPLTQATDPCEDPPAPIGTFAEGVTADRLVMAAAGTRVGAVALTEDQVTLATLEAGTTTTHAWSAKAERAFVAPLPEGGFGVVYSEDGAVRFGRAGQDPVTAIADADVVGAVAIPTGLKVLVHTGETYQMVDLDAQGAETYRHFVVNQAKVADMRLLDEGDFLFLPFTGPDQAQPVSFQTGSTTAGQCSLPASLGLELGVGTDWLGSALSYGFPIFAVRSPGPDGCPPRARVLARSTLGHELAADSAVGWGADVRVVPSGELAAAVTVQPTDAGGWRVAAQIIDLKNVALGRARLGFQVEGAPPPAAWDVTRARGKYLMVWSEPEGLEQRSFCFAEDLPASPAAAD